MGSYIGDGINFSTAKTKMPNVTVEGAELILEIGEKLKKILMTKNFLMIAMINAILEDKKLDIKWKNFKLD